MSRMSLLSDLTKSRLCLMVASTAVFGAFLAGAGSSLWHFATTFFGVLFLSMGSCAWNQLQETHLDALFPRTRGRPLPSGAMTRERASAIANSLMVLGLLILAVFSQGLSAMWCGLVAVFLYNGVYTPLKRVTNLAVIPGALCGSLPILIGALSQGWKFSDSSVVWLAFLTQSIWQVPHTWLILLHYRRDYAAFPTIYPTLLSRISVDQVRWLVVGWVLLYALVTLMFGASLSLAPVFAAALVVNMLALVGSIIFFLIVYKGLREANIPAFIHINVSLLLTMLIAAGGTL